MSGHVFAGHSQDSDVSNVLHILGGPKLKQTVHFLAEGAKFPQNAIRVVRADIKGYVQVRQQKTDEGIVLVVYFRPTSREENSVKWAKAMRRIPSLVDSQLCDA